jgi:hypothetical protein
MNEFYKGVILSLLTKALTGISAALVTNGWLSQDQTTQLVLGLAGLVGSVIMSVWQRYGDALLKNAALQITDPNATMNDAKALAKTNAVAPATQSPDASPQSVPNVASIKNLMVLLLIVPLVTLVACGGKPVPVLVGESATVASAFLEQASTAAASIEQPQGPLPKLRALDVQLKLKEANTNLRKLVPVLKAIDAAQKSGDPTAPLIEQALALIGSVSSDLNLSVQGVPVVEAAAKLLEVVNNARGAIATVKATLDAIRARTSSSIQPALDALEPLMRPAIPTVAAN